MELTVSEPVAEFFMQQCVGEHSGHMSMIPNNPVLYGLVQSHRALGRNEFVRFLRQIADQLDKDIPF